MDFLMIEFRVFLSKGAVRDRYWGIIPMGSMTMSTVKAILKKSRIIGCIIIKIPVYFNDPRIRQDGVFQSGMLKGNGELRTEDTAPGAFT
jgi:hypothetical protein